MQTILVTFGLVLKFSPKKKGIPLYILLLSSACPLDTQVPAEVESCFPPEMPREHTHEKLLYPSGPIVEVNWARRDGSATTFHILRLREGGSIWCDHNHIPASNRITLLPI